MISKTGNNLEILILTQPERDWQTFSTWYGVWKNLPDAHVRILCIRNEECPFQFYQWTKRLKVPHTILNAIEKDENLNRLHLLGAVGGEAVLVITTHQMVLEPLSEYLLKWLEGAPGIWVDGPVWFCNLNQTNRRKLLESHYLLGTDYLSPSPLRLYQEAKESDEPTSVVGILKGCGKWIHTARGCPFSSAAGLVGENMTINEFRVIELWKKMVPLYSITS